MNKTLPVFAALALGLSKKAGPIAIILGAGVVGLLIY